MKQIGIWRITALVSSLPERERWLASVPGRDYPGDANLLEEIKRVQGWAKPEEELQIKFEPVDTSKLFSSPMYGDCCSWGPFELYEDHEKLLKLVLEDDIKQWDTGWAGCKKEIVSFRAARDGDEVVCQASCSDDFDTEGNGGVVIHLDARETFQGDWVEHSYERILEGLGEAWGQGVDDRKENEVYQGYSIHFLLKPEDTSGPSVETLILAKDPGYDEPPGDNYSEWGFQGETELPQYLKDWIERWAWDRLYGLVEGESKVFPLREPILHQHTVYGYDDAGNQTETQTEVPVTQVMVRRWEDD